MKLILSLLLIFWLSLTLEAQEFKLLGTVTSNDNSEPIPGVNILVKGTSRGSVSDLNGSFEISAASGEVLVFSFVGYISKEVTVGNQTILSIGLDVDVVALEEVVVTGYSAQRQSDITGAVSVVDAEQLNEMAATSFTQKLEGRVAGVQISTSGQPGTATNVRIRGISSFQNNDPLYMLILLPNNSS